MIFTKNINEFSIRKIAEAVITPFSLPFKDIEFINMLFLRKFSVGISIFAFTNKYLVVQWLYTVNLIIIALVSWSSHLLAFNFGITALKSVS